MKTLQDSLVAEFGNKSRKLSDNKAWLKTPAIGKLLDSIEYLATKHGAIRYSHADAYGAYVTLTMKGLNGLKDEGLAALLEGFVCADPDSVSNYDNAAGFARSYTFSWYGETTSEEGYWNRPSLNLTVTANFKQDSETCHRVITGYTTPDSKPQPIYELVCSDDPKAEGLLIPVAKGSREDDIPDPTDVEEIKSAQAREVDDDIPF